MEIKILIFLFFGVNIVFGNISTVAVSPFISSDFSGTYVFSFFPMWDNSIGFRYENHLTPPNNSINIIETSYRNYFAESAYISLGIKNRVEIELALFFTMLNSQIKINVFNHYNEHRFFRNFSASSFVGQYLRRGTFRGYLLNRYNDVYGGISVGTKHSVNKYLEFELYSSPLIYKGEWEILVLPRSEFYNRYGDVDFLSLNIPIGIRMLIGNRHKISTDFGIIPIIKLKDTWMNTYPMALFTKASFHWGRKNTRP